MRLRNGGRGEAPQGIRPRLRHLCSSIQYFHSFMYTHQHVCLADQVKTNEVCYGGCCKPPFMKVRIFGSCCNCFREVLIGPHENHMEGAALFVSPLPTTVFLIFRLLQLIEIRYCMDKKQEIIIFKKTFLYPNIKPMKHPVCLVILSSVMSLLFYCRLHDLR